MLWGYWLRHKGRHGGQAKGGAKKTAPQTVQGGGIMELLIVFGYTALSILLALLIARAIVGGGDDWDDRFR